jgi:hypothetical protein
MPRRGMVTQEVGGPNSRKSWGNEDFAFKNGGSSLLFLFMYMYVGREKG